jgi:hypothetical protein
MAALKEKCDAMREQLLTLGEGDYEGDMFRVTVRMPERATPDWKAIAQTLKPSLRLPRDKWSEQLIELVDGNTETKIVPTVKATARIGKVA